MNDKRDYSAGDEDIIKLFVLAYLILVLALAL